MVPNVKSSTLQRIFPDEYMLEAFGKLNPSRSERTVYFFDKWCEWHNNKIKISHLNTQKIHDIQKILDQLGVKEFWDYQMRNGEIRFIDSETLGFFKISAAHLLN